MTTHRIGRAIVVAAAVALAACSGKPASAPALASSRSALTVVPPDSSFHAFLCSGTVKGDPAGDQMTGGAWRDIVGDEIHPAFYRAADAQNIYFRMRVSGDPRKPGSLTELQPSSWDVLVDTDNKPSTYEYMFTADGNLPGGNAVQLVRNSVQEMSNPTDPALDDKATDLIADLTPATDYWSVKVASDGNPPSAFGGDPDYFMTLVLPKQILRDVGVDLNKDFVVWAGTNARTYSLNSDFGCFVGIPPNLGDAGNNPGDLDPPDAIDDAVTTPEDTPIVIDVLANDTGIEPVTASAPGTAIAIETSPAHGDVTVGSDRTVTYSPAPDWFGIDTFTYRVTDDTGETDTAVVTVTVTPVDDAPPVAVDDAWTMVQGTTTTIDVLANDAVIDGVTSLTVLTPPASGTAAVNPDRTISYTADASFVGTVTFTYEVTDTDGQTGTATVTITVRLRDNGFPVAAGDSASTPEDTLVTIPVLANDTVLDQPAVVTLATTPANGTATVNSNNTVDYTPSSNYFGPDFFTYQVTDLDGQSATATVSITITPVDDGPPIATEDAATTPEGTAVGVAVLANDTVKDGLGAVTIVTPPTHGTAVVNADHAITYTPTGGFFGVDELVYQVTDLDHQAASAPVTIRVTPVDSGAPMATPDAFTTAEDTALPSLGVLANDVVLDGPAIVSLATPPAHGTATVNVDGTIAYAPAPDYAGPDALTYRVTDRDGQADTATVSIVVTPVGDAPVANPDAATAHAAWPPVVIPVLANDTDADGDALSVTSATQGGQGTVTVLPDGTIQYLAAAGFVGVDTFTYLVSDGTAADSTTVTVTVTPPLDSDGDGIPDYIEDTNHDGTIDPGETDPGDPDTDGDGLPDGVEDSNHDGTVDPGETDPGNPDTDGDGLPDGVEDSNHDGTVNPGETDPRNPDTNGDGILDGIGVRGGGCGSGPGGGASLLLVGMAALLRRRGPKAASR
jgi:hypothetical protein